MGPNISFIPIIALTLLGIAGGIALILWARRARRIDDHRTCRRCRFDLTGLRENEEECPECGSALGARRAIRIGNRRVHRPMLLLGLLLIFLSLGIGGVSFARRAAGFDFNRIKPVWLLAREVRTGSVPTADAAIAEFSRRLTASQLNDARAREIVTLALARQADPVAGWSNAWGDYLDAAWQAQIMTPEERANYLLTGIQLTMTCRNRMRQQHALSMQMQITAARLGSNTSFAVDYSLDRLTIGPSVMETPFSGELKSRGGSRSETRRGSGASIDAPQGDHELVATWTLKIKGLDEDLPRKQRSLTLTQRVVIVGADDPPVRLLVDDDLRAKIAAALSVTELTAYPSEGKEPATVDLTIAQDKLPCNVVGRVFLREPNPPPGRPARQWQVSEHHLGPVSAPTSMRWQRNWITGPGPLDLEVVDVVLVPDTNTAEANPNLDEIWGEEVVIRRVKVKKAGTP